MSAMMSLAQAHALLLPAVPEARLIGDGSQRFERVHSDSRSLREGDLFVALRGEVFDAHAFLARAKSAGAVAALAERGIAEAGLSGIEVPDSLAALTALAAAWRAQCHLPMIAVAGSNGKTTVTQMTASILSAWQGEAAFATQGNFNNHIGVPLTLLRLRQNESVWHRVGVMELGMNHRGEIAQLAALCAPTVALVNNAQREHQEFMHSVEATARENGAVISALGPAGVAVFPLDDEYAAVWQAMAGSRPVLSFALGGEADVTGSASWVATPDGGHWALELHTPVGVAPVMLRVAGAHNVRNALAAATCALAAGAPLDAIRRGLEAFEPVKGRSQLSHIRFHGHDLTLIDDSYNANPDSVRAAIDLLVALPGPNWLVLGDMGEVGTKGVEFHREVGAYAKAQGIDQLWTVGRASRDVCQAYGGGARHFITVAELVAALPQAPQTSAALVKGSRFMQMEQVVAALVASPELGGAHAA
jgi:UDP-N-acetylmuramoyl-tripeptide--D-alanyl-D-alanine ligase